jgi:hypothetical protein
MIECIEDREKTERYETIREGLERVEGGSGVSAEFLERKRKG